MSAKPKRRKPRPNWRRHAEAILEEWADTFGHAWERLSSDRWQGTRDSYDELVDDLVILAEGAYQRGLEEGRKGGGA